MLLACRTKSQFASWSNTPQRPLDAVYGSGQVNVYNSYDILTAGQQESGSVTRQGWDFNQTAEPGSYRTYTFTVPDGTDVGEMSIALTWNRIIRSTLVGGFGNLQSDLADLNMAISRIDGDTSVPIDASLSAVDNVEYLSLRNLAAGTYQVAIAADQANVDYVLAWNALANTSTTTLTATAGPIAVGQNVTFTAKVAAGNLVSGNPSGTVTFFDGDTPLDTNT